MKKGYTLIELLCCLAIVTIISAICLPNIKMINEYIKRRKFTAASNVLLQDLRYAKSFAVTHGRFTKLIFNDKGYSMICNTKKIKDVYFENSIHLDTAKSTLPTNHKLGFKSTGVAVPYGCTIAIIDDAGNSSSITIKVGTYTVDYKK